jgi:multidrug efflux pump subunit AcrA (membrane-fusion protein)
MTAVGTVLAKSISLRIIPVFILACFAIPSAPAQQQSASDTHEYKATVVAARESEVAPRRDGLLTKINFTADQTVKQGDLLFEFGMSERELNVVLLSSIRTK